MTHDDSSSGRLLEVLMKLSEGEPADALATTRALREALATFGSETPDNLAAMDNLEVRPVQNGRLGLCVKDGPALAELANHLEDCGLPSLLQAAFPGLTSSQWDAFTRLTTLVFVALEGETPDGKTAG